MLTKKQHDAAYDRISKEIAALDRELEKLDNMRGITKKQATNLERALAVMKSVSPRRIDLDVIRLEPKKFSHAVDDEKLKKGCGAVACVGGWCSADQHFKAQGLTYSVEDEYLAFRSRKSGTTQDLSIMSQELFGWRDLFDGAETNLHPKKEAIKRLQDAINNSYIG